MTLTPLPTLLQPCLLSLPVVENPKFLRTPVTSAAVDSGVVATYFELLGERNVVKYMDFSFVVSPCYNRWVKNFGFACFIEIRRKKNAHR